MIPLKCGQAILTHIAGKDGGIAAAEIHKYEAVEDIGEVAVDVEADEASSEFGVMFEQNGDGFAVAFDVGDGVGEFLQVAEAGAGGAAIGRLDTARAEGITGSDPAGEVSCA